MCWIKINGEESNMRICALEASSFGLQSHSLISYSNLFTSRLPNSALFQFQESKWWNQGRDYGILSIIGCLLVLPCWQATWGWEWDQRQGQQMEDNQKMLFRPTQDCRREIQWIFWPRLFYDPLWESKTPTCWQTLCISSQMVLCWVIWL